MKKLEIIQWYTGEIVRHQIRVIAACPSIELVGAYVHHEEESGVDIGEIAGIGPVGSYASEAEPRRPKGLAPSANSVR